MDANSINTFVESAGKVIEKVPEVYNDGLQPTVKESGKTLSFIPRAINAALAPIEKWMLHQEYSVAETKALLEKKLQNIDYEKIVAPEPYVAVPTLQAISYCMDCEELRELFANLLAKSMNLDTKALVHPSYSEIIKQLSPLDANILKLFISKSYYPIVEYRLKERTGISWDIYLTNVFIEYDCTEDIQFIAASITNLERLGLLSVDYNIFVSGNDVYEKFSLEKHYTEIRESIDKPPYIGYEDVVIQPGTVTLTPFGKNFIQICVQPL